MLSKSAEYALRALHALAFEPGGGPVPSTRLAERVGVPENYLSKLLHRLEQEGVVRSRRGRGGGFTLSLDPAAVPLADVIRPFDDTVLRRHCLLGRPECRDDSPCAAHDEWTEVSARVRRFFRETSLDDLGPPADAPPQFDARTDAAASDEAAVGAALAGGEGAIRDDLGPTEPREAT